ncbi:MAG: PIG-L deacetylase family protein [Bacillota bacterium]
MDVPIAVFVFWSVLTLYLLRLLFFLIYKEFLRNLFHRIPLFKLAVPWSKSRILIIAPHPDDEIAACGGLILKAVERSARIKVILLSNGDGLGLAERVTSPFKQPSAPYFVDQAYKRQKETIDALSLLGLSEKDMIFLGFPDRHFSELWRENWMPDKPCTSRFTGQNAALYHNAYKPGAGYNGVGLVTQLEEIIRDFKPTHIFYPHFYDCHSDHHMANNFIKYTITKLRLSIKEYTYLVHRGNWPVPPGRFPRLHLTPPKALGYCGIKWHSLDLSEAEVKLKEKCLGIFKSQLKNYILRKYLLAFLRKNELFCTFNHIILPIDKKHRAVVPNPFADTLRSYLYKSGDIAGLTVYMDRENLNFEIRLMKKPCRGYIYMLDISFFNALAEARRTLFTVTWPGQLQRHTFAGEPIPWIEHAFCHMKKNDIFISLPCKDLSGLESFLVNASAYKGGKLVDRTGLRHIMLTGKDLGTQPNNALWQAPEPWEHYSVFPGKTGQRGNPPLPHRL